jgi:hypothetical protein
MIIQSSFIIGKSPLQLKDKAGSRLDIMPKNPAVAARNGADLHSVKNTASETPVIPWGSVLIMMARLVR